MGRWLLAMICFGVCSASPGLAAPSLYYAVQPKRTALAQRFEVVANASTALNTRYVGETGVTASLLYHLREGVALELQGGWWFYRYDGTTFSQLSILGDGQGQPIEDKNGAVYAYDAPQAKYYRVPWFAALSVQWAPIYGKLAFHNRTLGEFAVYAIAGAGIEGIESGASNPPLPPQMVGVWGAGIRAHFSSHWGLRLEVRDLTSALWSYGDNSFSIAHKVALQLGASYVF